jgi:hypothetical protein
MQQCNKCGKHATRGCNLTQQATLKSFAVRVLERNTSAQQPRDSEAQKVLHVLSREDEVCNTSATAANANGERRQVAVACWHCHGERWNPRPAIFVLAPVSRGNARVSLRPGREHRTESDSN